MQLTANQQRVLAVLQEINRPLTAYALLAQLRRPGFTAPTQVYRALSRLQQRGLVHRLETLNAYVACSCVRDCQQGFMAFAICDCCGRIDEFEDQELSQSLGRWASDNAFALSSNTIEIRGRCAACLRLAQG